MAFKLASSTEQIITTQIESNSVMDFQGTELADTDYVIRSCPNNPPSSINPYTQRCIITGSNVRIINKYGEQSILSNVKGIYGIRADGVIVLRPTKNIGESTSGGDWYPEGTGILFYNCEIGRSSNGRILSQRGSSVTLQNCTLRSSITGWYVGSSGATEGTLTLTGDVTINCSSGIGNTQTTPLGTVNIANNTYIYTPTTGVPNDIIWKVKTLVVGRGCRIYNGTSYVNLTHGTYTNATLNRITGAITQAV